MRPGNGKGVVLWFGIGLMLALVTLTGCVRVEVIDTTPVASTPNSPTTPSPGVSPSAGGGGDHNLAVLTVDFDPPLDYQQLIMQRQSVALLVTIENTGSNIERNLTVRAQLSTPEDADLFLTQGASIASIAPGTVQAVRFSRFGELPYHQTYHLEVMVDPVDGERDLSDNRKAFDIQIHQDRSSP